MFKVLLQSLILVSQIFSTGPLYNTSWRQQEMFHKITSPELYMEISRITKQEKRLEKEAKFQEKPSKPNGITRSSDGLKANIEGSLYSKQDVSLNLCLVFVYHLVSRPRHVETALLVATTFLIYEVTTFPLNSSMPDHLSPSNKPNTTKRNDQQITRNKRTQRTTLPRNYAFVQGSCDSGWYERNGQCYRIVQEKMIYDTAKEYCGTHNSEIVAVREEETNNFIHQLAIELHVTGYLWINVYNGYENWYPGHSGKNDGECVVMVRDGQWQNFDCRYQFAFGCEKDAPKPGYSEETLLIALLVPIFSCISVAMTLTTFLLIASVRRGDQPFKISSRYALKKTKRRIATWDMIDTLRKASIKRRSSRQKSSKRDSVPSIEVTSPSGEKCANPVRNNNTGIIKRRWSRRSLKRSGSQHPPPPESPNSSLYELLLRLNNMPFSQRYNIGIADRELAEKTSVEVVDERLGHGQKYSAGGNSAESIELVEIRKNGEHFEKNGKNCCHGDDKLRTIHQEHVKNGETSLKTHGDEERSFLNMAFRSSMASMVSMASIETNGSGGGNLARIAEKCHPEKEEADSDKGETCLQSSPEISYNKGGDNKNLPQSDSKEAKAGQREERSASSSKTTTTIKADVHKPIKDPSGTQVIAETNDDERTKVVWTYRI